MTQTILAVLLAGFLALSSETTYGLRNEHRRRIPEKDTRATRFRLGGVFASPANVLIIDFPFEPNYAYIRVDNAVYPLRIH
jgi:hypothetical protein